MLRFKKKNLRKIPRSELYKDFKIEIKEPVMFVKTGKKNRQERTFISKQRG